MYSQQTKFNRSRRAGRLRDRAVVTPRSVDAMAIAFLERMRSVKRPDVRHRRLDGGVLPKLPRQSILSNQEYLRVSVYQIVHNEVHIPTGRYIFIILTKQPSFIYMFSGNRERDSRIVGHTSFDVIDDARYLAEYDEYKRTGRMYHASTDQVKFAGILQWDNTLGLISWSNETGHYAMLDDEEVEDLDVGLPMHKFTTGYL